MKYEYKQPKAITMWDFSWLERRWDGAGYEDWNKALDELKLRGYDAVRIDAYPHLMAFGPTRAWTLKPAWDQQVWGAPSITVVDNLKAKLIEFISLCKKRNIAVGLSCWFREDVDRTCMNIKTPAQFADIWLYVLDAVKEAGLTDAILYVDLCNEYCNDCWIPFLKNDQEFRNMVKNGECTEDFWIKRNNPIAIRWMRESIEILKKSYPEFDYTFSQCDYFDELDELDSSMLDFLEPHIWMASYTDYYRKVNYTFQRFNSEGYDNVALHGEQIYRDNAEYWDGKLREGIKLLADWSRRQNKAMITTECWSIVDYKDGPLFKWDWIKHLCEVGVEQAVKEGRWVGIATSNFCGPQFVGMWRDVEWHQRLTGLIKSGKMPELK